MIVQRIGDRTQDFARRIFSKFEVVFREVTIGEVAFQPGNAAHRQAKKRGGLRAGSGDQFGTGPADIDHQALVFTAGGMRYALINQARFFLAANDLHRAAENISGFSQKLIGINRQTQRCGRDDADLRRGDILQALGEQP